MLEYNESYTIYLSMLLRIKKVSAGTIVNISIGVNVGLALNDL